MVRLATLPFKASRRSEPIGKKGWCLAGKHSADTFKGVGAALLGRKALQDMVGNHDLAIRNDYRGLPIAVNGVQPYHC
jgi:hypothetical protein